MTSARIRTRHNPNRALTLVEILIALTMTLIVLGAMMTAFQFASEQMQMGRSVMEIANRLRVAEELLRSDLSNLTVDPRPYTESSRPNGYCEIVEGPLRDFTYPSRIPSSGITISGIPNSIVPNNYAGDHDDVWMGTVRNPGQQFRGRYIPTNSSFNVGGNSFATVDPTTNPTVTVIESPLAEVVWWTSLHDDSDFIDDFNEDSVIVYRRVLLIRPGLPLPAFQNPENALQFLATVDISARVETLPGSVFQIVANSPSDLANRQNRFCHVHYPIMPTSPERRLLDRGLLFNLRSADFTGTLTGTNFDLSYTGNDIVLTDVTAFDLRVYSPNAGIELVSGQDSSVAVEPGDVWYHNTSARVAQGAFVDLHFGSQLGTELPAWFGGRADSKSGLSYEHRLDIDPNPSFFRLSFRENAYDTWTPEYESDRLDQDGDGLVDEATNGIDDAAGFLGTPAPDDDAERETRPPYPFPVRGIEATIRLVEKTTKQVQQTAIVHSYVPE